MTLLENVGRYTRPFAIVGGANFAESPAPSRAGYKLLFHSSCVTSLAANARKIPGLTKLSASPLDAYHAQRMPVESVPPLEETDNPAPLCPPGPPPPL